MTIVDDFLPACDYLGMADDVHQTPGPGKASKANTTAGKDNKRLKANKHITQDLPDRRKEAKLEAEVQALIAEQQESGLTAEQQVAVELIRQGFSWRGIVKLNGKAPRLVAIGDVLPKGFHFSANQLTRWKHNIPEFADACKQACNDYVENNALEVMARIESMGHVKGLKGLSKIIAIDKQVQRTLQVAKIRLPDWNEDNEAGAEVIVFEVGDGWQPQRRVEGSPGQGTDGEAAIARIAAMRNVTPNAG